ncbi:hypothetical protein OGZ02_00290 [Brachyspira hyodysenteriae]|nr:hypothetical protein [Brachyspira hyodysenteriae]MDA1467310.1 hypothetical protein [Brachyspira hyodysenteriae]
MFENILKDFTLTVSGANQSLDAVNALTSVYSFNFYEIQLLSNFGSTS